MSSYSKKLQAHREGSISDSECTNDSTRNVSSKIGPLSPHRVTRRRLLNTSTIHLIPNSNSSKGNLIPPWNGHDLESEDSEQDQDDDGEMAQHPKLKMNNIQCIIINHEILARSVHRRLRKNRNALAFIIQVQDQDDRHTVKRRFSHFKALHQMLRRKFPRSTSMPLVLPITKIRRLEAFYVQEQIALLNAYLSTLLEIPEIVKSSIFSQFLDDFPLSDDSDEYDGTLSQYLLHSFPERQVVVPKGHAYKLNLQVQQPGSSVVWEFHTRKYDIAVSATFNDQEVFPYSRKTSYLKHIRGSYECPGAGVFTITWDNSFSWTRSKRLIYRAEILDKALVQATAIKFMTTDRSSATLSESELVEEALEKEPAQQNDDPLVEKSQFRSQSDFPSSSNTLAQLSKTNEGTRSQSLGTIEFQKGGVKGTNVVARQGYIQKCQRPLQRPPSASSDNDTEICGWLIIHRGRVFRQKNWYKRWFALDVQKGVLRYFSHEPRPGRKLLPKRTTRGKLDLGQRHVALSMVGSHATGPTSFGFAIAGGKRHRCWNICALSSEDYDMWVEGITSSIFVVHWLRETRCQPQVGKEDPLDREPEVPEEAFGLLEPGGFGTNVQDVGPFETRMLHQEEITLSELHANPTEAQKTPQRYLSPIGPATWMAYRIPNVQSSVTSKWAFVLALNILLWCLRYFQHWMILIPILVVGNASAVCGLVQFFGHRINLEKKNM